MTSDLEERGQMFALGDNRMSLEPTATSEL